MNGLKGNSNFMRLTIANTFNEVGLTISHVIVPLTILHISNSPTLAGLVGALGLAANTLGSIFAGAFVDRVNSAVLMRVSFLLEFVLWGLLAAMLTINSVPVALVACFSIALAFVSTIDGPAEFVLLKRIVKTSDLGVATSIIEARSSGAQLFGNPLAGLIYSWGGAIAFGFQSLLHLLGALLVPHLPPRLANAECDDSQETRTTFLNDVKEGFRIVFRNGDLRHLMYVASIANLGIVPMSFVILASFQQQGSASWLIGLLLSCFGLGVLAGAPLSARLSGRLSLSFLLKLALSTYFATTVLLIWGIANPWATGLLVIISGCALPSLNAAITSYTLAVTDEGNVGKVFSSSGVPGMILAPVGILVAGYLIGRWGTLPALIFQSVSMGIALIIVVASAHLSRIPKLADLQ